MLKINYQKNYSSLFALLFIICYSLSPAFPAFAQLDLSSFFNPLQQNTPTSTTPVPKLTPAEISLVWSAKTYTPADYLGKPLPSYNSLLEVLAIQTAPTKVDLTSLNYKWSLDGSFQQLDSGQNRSRFLFRASVLGDQQHFIALQIEDKEGRSVLNLSTTINIVTPEANIYPFEKQTINFIQANSGQDVLAPGQEKTFVALPYFFDINNFSALSFQWNFNGQIINKTEEKNKFTIKMASGDLQESFVQPLLVLAVNPQNELQRATGKLDITVKK